MKMHKIAFVLVIIGGLNWGLTGLGNLMMSDWNIIHLLVFSLPVYQILIESLIYILVGLSAVVLLVGHKKDCRACGTSAAPGM